MKLKITSVIYVKKKAKTFYVCLKFGIVNQANTILFWKSGINGNILDRLGTIQHY